MQASEKKSPDNGKKDRLLFIIKALLILALFGFLFSLSWRQVHNYDIWWHLASGKHITQEHSIPHEDMFSFTRKGNTWIDLHWGFQVAVFQANKLLGPAGLVGLKTGMLFAAWLLLFLWPATRPHVLLAGIFFSMGMAAGLNTCLVRPTVASLAFLAACLVLLEQGSRGNRKWLWFLVPLQILWVNFHSLYILGLFCIYSFLAGEILQRLMARNRKETVFPAQIKTLAVIAPIATLACLINPYHYHAILFPFQLLREVSGHGGAISQSTLEFTPPYYTLLTTLPMRSFRILLWLSGLSFLFNLKRIRLPHLLVYIGFAYLALIAIRNLSLFGLVAAVVSVYNYGEAWNSVRDRIAAPALLRRAAVAACAGLIFISLAFMGWRLANNRIKTEAPFGAEAQSGRYPAGACDFIVREKVQGPGFNVFEDGGYLIWRLYPEYQVFIDGRQEVSGERFFNQYSQMIMYPFLFRELSRPWNFNYILLNHTNTAYHDLILWLYHDPGYALVYLDSVSILWVQLTGRNAEIIQKNKIKLFDIEHPAPPPVPLEAQTRQKSREPLRQKAAKRLQLGMLYSTLGLPGRAMQEYAKALELDPAGAMIYFQIGVLLYELEKKEAAPSYVEYSVSLNPHLVNAHVALAMWSEKADPEKAEKHYLEALSAFPHYGPVHQQLALLYFQQGRLEKSLDQIKAARQDPRYPAPAELDLQEARALFGLGKMKKAEAILKHYLDKHPDDTEAQELLKRVGG